MPTCESIETTSWNFTGFEKSIDLMRNPTKNFKIIEEELFINGVSIMEYAKKAAEAYGSGHYQMFGEEMGEILKLANHVDTSVVAVKEKTHHKKHYTAE
jgi:hypothetical protein